MAALRRTHLGGGVLLAVLSVGAASGTGAVLMIVLFIVLSRIKHRIPLGRVRTP